MPDSWVEGGYEVYIVPSASMEPTLRVGERFFAHAPNPDAGFHRGEVIVFRTGPGEGVDYVKRVVGLAGDVVQMRAGILHINGAPVPREALGLQAGGTATLYLETLPGGAAHEILEQTDDGYSDNTPEFHVPGGHLFMMGDNRDNSLDSRATVGFVPVARVTARARFILWGPDRSRVGTRLD